MKIKIVEDISNNLSGEDCLYIKLDYNNPFIENNKIAYPVLNAWYEKSTVDNIFELKIKMPELPDLNNYSFVNITKINDEYKIYILKEPIRILNDKINIINYIDNFYYILKENKWDKNINNVTYKSSFDKKDMEIIYSNYNIYDNNGNLYFKKNEIDDFYKYILNNT